jgi:hypothetical protein
MMSPACTYHEQVLGLAIGRKGESEHMKVEGAAITLSSSVVITTSSIAIPPFLREGP